MFEETIRRGPGGLSAAAIFLLVLAGSPALGGEPNHSREQALQLASAPVAEAEIARLINATPWLPSATLKAEIEAIADRSDWPAPVRERVLYGYARQLRNLAPQAHVYGILEQLTRYQEQVLVPHPESENHGVPLFNVAAAASGTRNAWDAELVRERTATALRLGDTAYFEALADRPLSNAELTGLGLALGASAPEQLRHVRSGFHALLRARPEAARLALPASTVLDSTEPLAVVVSGAAAGEAVAVVARVGEHVSAAKARAFWSSLLEHESAPLASTALVQLAAAGALETAKADASRLLADEDLGAAAALALARAGSVDTLIGILESAEEPARARQRAALALKMEGSARSRAALSRLVANEPQSALAGEVSKWVK